MKKKIIVFTVLLFISFSMQGQTKDNDIKKLMEMTGSADLGLQVMTSMLDQFKQILPDVPDNYWDQFFNEVTAEEMIELIIPIYSNHFTHDEIKDIIAFYKTETGMKFIEKQPVILQESMIIGQQWGMEIAEKIQNKLAEDEYL